MALTNLTSLTQAQYQALNISSFSSPPIISFTGDPDGAIAPELGGWVGTDVLAFTIINGQNTNSGLSIDPNPRNTNTIDANVVPGSNPDTVITYWTVNMGSNASGGDWEISIQVDANNTNTGTWKFVKGKSTDPVESNYR